MSKSFSPNPEEKAHASSSPPTRDRSSSSRQGGQDDGRLWQRLAFGAHDEAEHAGGEKAQAVREQMGEGRLLEAGVRGQMEHGFGSALRHVRVHTDGEAGSLAVDHQLAPQPAADPGVELARELLELLLASLALPGLQVLEASSSPAKISRRGRYLADGNDDVVFAINRSGQAFPALNSLIRMVPYREK